jgi:hypothetical protein
MIASSFVDNSYLVYLLFIQNYNNRWLLTFLVLCKVMVYDCYIYIVCCIHNSSASIYVNCQRLKWKL